MIIRVLKRGRDMPGLMRYLFSDGKTNEHTNQHLVGGSPQLMSEFGVSEQATVPEAPWMLAIDVPGAQQEAQSTSRRTSSSTSALSAAEAGLLGQQVEGAWRAQHAESQVLVGAGGSAPRGGVSSASRHDSVEPAHVYHVTMSLRPDEGTYTDEQWNTLAREFVQGMGFDTGDHEQACRWVAVRHGLSAEGNDHVHLAVSLVRNNGERASLRYINPATGKTIGDRKQSQLIRREMEARHDFVRPLSDVGLDAQGSGASSYSRAEARRASTRERTGMRVEEPDRLYLAKVVRGAAAAASTEAEFVRNVLDSGIDVEPRWQKGGRTEVVGYSVKMGTSTRAPSPVGADESVRFGGKKLGADLTITKLRTRWASNETEQTRAEALSLWRGENLTATLAPKGEDLEQTLQAAAGHLSAENDRLERLDPHDRAAWKIAAARQAETVSLVAARGDRPGPDKRRVDAKDLRAVSNRLTQAMMSDRSGGPAPVHHSPADHTALAARQLSLALRAGGMSSARGWLAVMQQMQRTARAVQAAREARRDAQAAMTDVRRPLAAVTRNVATATIPAEQRELLRRTQLTPGTTAERVAGARRRGPTNNLTAVPRRPSYGPFPPSHGSEL